MSGAEKLLRQDLCDPLVEGKRGKAALLLVECCGAENETRGLDLEGVGENFQLDDLLCWLLENGF